MKIRRATPLLFGSFLAAITVLFATPTSAETNTVNYAQAMIAPTHGNSAYGIVTFVQEPNGIKVIADMKDLAPGKHGFHVHEFGDCSEPNAASAGGHFNPDHVEHGSPDAPTHHEGDFGNIVADNDGNAKYNYVDKNLSFQGAHSILGRSVIIHEHADDLVSQPAGNSGPRIACGVIGVIEAIK